MKQKLLVLTLVLFVLLLLVSTALFLQNRNAAVEPAQDEANAAVEETPEPTPPPTPEKREANLNGMAANVSKGTVKQNTNKSKKHKKKK